MRNRLVALLVVLLAAVALSVAFAQNGQNAGAGVRKEASTWPYGGPDGTFYKGAGVQTIIGKPHKLGTQEVYTYDEYVGGAGYNHSHWNDYYNITYTGAN